MRTNSVPNPRLECEYDDLELVQARKSVGDRVKRQRLVGDGEASRSRSSERRGAAGYDLNDAAAIHPSLLAPLPPPGISFHPPDSRAPFPLPAAPTPMTQDIIANSGYALPTLATGRWYEPGGDKASQVAAAQLAEIRTLKEHVGGSPRLPPFNLY